MNQTLKKYRSLLTRPKVDENTRPPDIKVTLDEPEGFFQFAHSLDVDYIFYRTEKYIESDPQKTSVSLNFIVKNNNSTIKAVNSFSFDGNQSVKKVLNNNILDKNYEPVFIKGQVEIIGR